MFSIRVSPRVATGGVVKLEKFARHPLLFGPSPVHPLERLTNFLGGAEVWAKREDCNSGLAYGGEKNRKLGDPVSAALAPGCGTLVSLGRGQSKPPPHGPPPA